MAVIGLCLGGRQLALGITTALTAIAFWCPEWVELTIRFEHCAIGRIFEYPAKSPEIAPPQRSTSASDKFHGTSEITKNRTVYAGTGKVSSPPSARSPRPQPIPFA